MSAIRFSTGFERFPSIIYISLRMQNPQLNDFVRPPPPFRHTAAALACPIAHRRVYVYILPWNVYLYNLGRVIGPPTVL